MAFLSAGCGKKGPPLAPLRLVPEPAANVTARRLGDTVYVQMTAPARNTNGPGPVALDRVEIYAVTAAPGAAPPNRELLSNARVVAKIPIKPAPRDDDPPPPEDAPKDTRPGPGDAVTFAEKLTEAELKPQFVPPAKAAGANAAVETPAETTTAETTGTPTPTGAAAATPAPEAMTVPAAGGTSVGGAPGASATQTPPASPQPGATGTASAAPAGQATTGAATAPAAAAGTAATPPPAPALKVPTRIYIVRGITKGGRPGSPSARVAVPLVPPPPVPTALQTSFNESAVAVTWLPPVAEMTATSPMKFNVYVAPPANATGDEAIVAPTPLNPVPLDATGYEHSGAQPGVEQCFVVRAVETIGGASVESEPSQRACVTPRDTFPPAAPKNLSAVAGPGAINLIWDANTEGDLAGYLILRGLAPGDTLQPLNAEPTRDTRFRDTTVSPGARYVYAIIAVDRAGNRSAASPRVEETAR